MANFVGGAPLNISDAIKLTHYIKDLPRSKRECYGFSQLPNGEIFALYNNKKKLRAVTIIRVKTKDETGKTIIKTIPFNICEADLIVDKKNSRLHILLIKVDKQFRKHGVGSEVLSYLETYAKNHKLKKITLDCLSTYTNGRETIVFRGDRDDIIKLEQLKKKGPVIDKNFKFYLKNGFQLNGSRKAEWPYLKPMVKKNLQVRKVKVFSLSQFAQFRFRKTDKYVKYTSPKETSKLIHKHMKREKGFNTFEIGGKQI